MRIGGGMYEEALLAVSVLVSAIDLHVCIRFIIIGTVGNLGRNVTLNGYHIVSWLAGWMKRG